MKIQRLVTLSIFILLLGITSVLIRIEFDQATRIESEYVSVEISQLEATALDWPSERGFFIDLKQIEIAPYLYLELSKHDTYDVQFINSQKDKTAHMVVSSMEWAWYEEDLMRPILQRIPSTITEMGYDQLLIRPLDGDAEYALRNLQLMDEVTDMGHYVNTVDFEIKQLEIFVDPLDYELLAKKREEAIQLDVLLADDAYEVEASFLADGQETQGTLRLKGDWTDHLIGDKWSFRIDLKSDDTIFHMTEFSIQDPLTRLGYNETLIYEYYRSVGGVAIRYEFIDVFVNGIYKGVYAVEEFFTSDMIENSEKRAGPIIKASEDVLWQARAYELEVPEYKNIIEVFNYKDAISDERALELSTYAINLYESFLEGKLSLDQVFDVDLLAKYYAIVDIFGASHGSLYWHNFRYYLNPLTMKLEPIPFDELSFEYGSLKFEVGPPQFLEDAAYRALYLSYLKEYMVDIPSFLEEQKDWIDEMSLTLQRDASYVGNLEPLSYQLWVLEDKIQEIEAMR